TTLAAPSCALAASSCSPAPSSSPPPPSPGSPTAPPSPPLEASPPLPAARLAALREPGTACHRPCGLPRPPYREIVLPSGASASAMQDARWSSSHVRAITHRAVRRYLRVRARAARGVLLLQEPLRA